VLENFYRTYYVHGIMRMPSMMRNAYRNLADCRWVHVQPCKSWVQVYLLKRKN